MAHWSEDSQQLEMHFQSEDALSALPDPMKCQETVLLFWLPPQRACEDELEAMESFTRLADYCALLPKEAVVCFLTTPPDAATLLPYLEETLNYQLWVAVKTSEEAFPVKAGELPNRHAALLVLTRYAGALKHTKTRIGYTYCPACGKTTKDYGGKKHTYHEYGTLMSDVWRDIECNLRNSIESVTDRLRDVFGLSPYKNLRVLDLRLCKELQPHRKPDTLKETRLPLEWNQEALPLGSGLINGDCLEVLQSLPDNSVDFCFADPPYNLQKKYDHWNDALESIEYFAWCDTWLTELYRVLKPGRTLAILNIPQWAVRHFQHLASIMRFQEWITWEALGFPVRMIMPANYSLLCFSKGEARPLPGLCNRENRYQGVEDLLPLAEGYCLRAACVAKRNRNRPTDRGELSDLWYDIHRLKHNSRRVDHPCQLPPLLMRRLFALFTQPEDVVLDCFNGSGTSTLVAQQMSRRFIGIELSPQYHELAERRHKELSCGKDPFGKEETVPQAKNSPVRRMPKQKYVVSKKALQLDVRRIAKELGRLPSREEVSSLSAYPIEYFEQYFASWGEVCAAARTTGMSELPTEAAQLSPQFSLTLEE